jgi:hypothetical protein
LARRADTLRRAARAMLRAQHATNSFNHIKPSPKMLKIPWGRFEHLRLLRQFVPGFVIGAQKYVGGVLRSYEYPKPFCPSSDQMSKIKWGGVLDI